LTLQRPPLRKRRHTFRTVWDARQRVLQKELKMTEHTYWKAPSWMKAVILNGDGNHMGDMETSVQLQAKRWDPLGIFSCDNAVGAVKTATDAFETTSPHRAALGVIGDIVFARPFLVKWWWAVDWWASVVESLGSGRTATVQLYLSRIKEGNSATGKADSRKQE
ncbi:hypothetical protein K469DRAFT_756906, partial [Zopfia rhizophila CBS 207.26]